MAKIVILIFLVLTSVFAAEKYEPAQLQGAWSSGPANPTADFSIEGEQVWLDHDARHHPFRIEGDVLVFDLGDRGQVRNRIISLVGNKLVLEHLETRQRRTLAKAK